MHKLRASSSMDDFGLIRFTSPSVKVEASTPDGLPVKQEPVPSAVRAEAPYPADRPIKIEPPHPADRAAKVGPPRPADLKTEPRLNKRTPKKAEARNVRVEEHRTIETEANRVRYPQMFQACCSSTLFIDCIGEILHRSISPGIVLIPVVATDLCPSSTLEEISIGATWQTKRYA